MASTLKATFATRREAELVIERLVQEYKVDRSTIKVGPDGDSNTVGEALSAGDLPAAEPTVGGRDDAPVKGRIVVEVAEQGLANFAKVQEAFDEFNGARSGDASR